MGCRGVPARSPQAEAGQRVWVSWGDGRGSAQVCDECQRLCVRWVMSGEGEVPFLKSLGVFRACADADGRGPIEKEN